jgi:hypothetical protein
MNHELDVVAANQNPPIRLLVIESMSSFYWEEKSRLQTDSSNQSSNAPRKCAQTVKVK